MSIVNDALKKASKGFELKDQDTITPVLKTAAGRASDKKWTAIMITSLVIIVCIFGSFILYKNMSNFLQDEPDKSVSVVQSALNNIEQKAPAKTLRSKDAAKLNGIVYGNEGKWAIVNDRIVKEGDKLLGGQITSITKDIVKIEKNDGSEITLSLK